jgi:transcriptional regulator with XRE-family HTH domain
MGAKSLRQLRRERAWSTRELERHAGVAHQTVISAEAGKPLRLATIRKLADALGVRPMEVAEFARIIAEDGEATA